MIFDSPILCLVTNQVRSEIDCTLEIIESVTSCGVNMIQVREKSMEHESLLDYIKKIHVVKNPRSKQKTLYMPQGQVAPGTSNII